MSCVVEQRPLGRSGLTVSSVALGTAALALPYGPPGGERPPPARAAAVRVIAAALDRGVTFVDTAPGYADAEAIVGEAVGSRECVIATKVAPPPGGWQALGTEGLRDHVQRSVENSLRRLGRERVELLQAHNATRGAIAGGILGEALAAIRSAQRAVAIGVTVYDVEEAAAAIDAAWIDVVQVPYSPLDHRSEPLLDAAAATGTAVIARSVLLRGVLSPAAQSLTGTLEPLGRAADLFRRTVGASWEELPAAALGTVLAERRIASVLIGPRDVDELDALLDGAARWIDRPAPASPGLPETLLDPRRWGSISA